MLLLRLYIIKGRFATGSKGPSAQQEKRSLALKNLYLDKISGVLSEEHFMELNHNFLAEKNHPNLRLDQIGD